jgi:hypothetical protein
MTGAAQLIANFLRRAKQTRQATEIEQEQGPHHFEPWREVFGDPRQRRQRW